MSVPISSSTTTDPYKWCYLPITIRILNSGTRNKLFGLSGIYLAALNTTDGTTSEFIISLNTLPAEIQSSSLRLEVFFTTNQLVDNKKSGDSSIQWIQCKVIDWINFQNDNLNAFLSNGFQFHPNFSSSVANSGLHKISSSILVAKPKYKFFGSLKPSGIQAKEITLVGTSFCEQNCDLKTENLPLQIFLEVCPFGLSNVSIFSGYTSNGFINYKSSDGSLYLSDIKYLDNMDGGIANIFVNGQRQQNPIFSLGLVLGNLVKRDGSGELMVILSWNYIMKFMTGILASELSHTNYLTNSHFRGNTANIANHDTVSPAVNKLKGKSASNANWKSSLSTLPKLQNLQTCYCSAQIQSSIIEAGTKAFKRREGGILKSKSLNIFPNVDASSVVAITTHHGNGENFWGSGVKLSDNLIVTNRHVVFGEHNAAPVSLKIWGHCLGFKIEITDPLVDKDLYIPFEGKIYDICYIRLQRNKNALSPVLNESLNKLVESGDSLHNSSPKDISVSVLSVGFGLFFQGLRENELRLQKSDALTQQQYKPLYSNGYVSAQVKLPIFESLSYDVTAMVVASCSCWAGSSGGGVFQLNETESQSQKFSGIMVSNGKLSNGETLSKLNLIIPLDIVALGLYDLFVEGLKLTPGIEKQLDSLWKLQELYKDVFMESSKL